VAAICYSFVLWLRLRRCATWRSTDGTIIRSDKTITCHNFQKIEKVTIRYTYFVGCRYESETVKIGGFIHARKRDENALLSEYPVGRTVQVYYDPYKPQVACLEKRGMDSILAIRGYGCFATLIGLLLYFLA
jgi:Protein of unknown function (DUF3592)